MLSRYPIIWRTTSVGVRTVETSSVIYIMRTVTPRSLDTHTRETVASEIAGGTITPWQVESSSVNVVAPGSEASV